MQSVFYFYFGEFLQFTLKSLKFSVNLQTEISSFNLFAKLLQLEIAFYLLFVIHFLYFLFVMPKMLFLDRAV